MKLSQRLVKNCTNKYDHVQYLNEYPDFIISRSIICSTYLENIEDVGLFAVNLFILLW